MNAAQDKNLQLMATASNVNLTQEYQMILQIVFQTYAMKIKYWPPMEHVWIVQNTHKQ